MTPRCSARGKRKRKTQTTSTSALAATGQSSPSPPASASTKPASSTPDHDFPLPAPSTSSSHSTARILRTRARIVETSPGMKRLNPGRFEAASRTLVPTYPMAERRVVFEPPQLEIPSQSPQPSVADQQNAGEAEMIVIPCYIPAQMPNIGAHLTAPDVPEPFDDNEDEIDELEPSPHPQPRILVPASSSPPREEDVSTIINISMEPPPKKRRRTYSIHDELSSPPSTAITSIADHDNDEVARALNAEFDALASTSTASTSVIRLGGPALGEPSSSRRRIAAVPSSPSKPSTSKFPTTAVTLVPSRSPSPSSNNFPSSSSNKQQPTGPEPEPLSTYVCPICLSPPTNATLTPCGHICCGECLFTAVRSALQRAATQATREPIQPRCPVCRAVLKNWDGRGRGVIGLKPRVMIAL